MKDLSRTRKAFEKGCRRVVFVVGRWNCLLVAGVCIAALTSCAQPIGETVRSGAAAVGIPASSLGVSVVPGEVSRSLDLPRQVGDPQAVAEDRRRALFREYALEDDPQLTAYLNGLLARILQLVKAPDACCRVEILETHSLEAYSTASGSIFVTVGWLELAQSEDELVALIAHEMGHIAKGHYASSDWADGTLTIQQFYRFGTVAAKIATKKVGISFDMPVQNAVMVIRQLVHPSLNRSQEREADQFSVEVTKRLGYSMVRGPKAFLERLASAEDRDAGRLEKAAKVADPDFVKPLLELLGRQHDSGRERIDGAVTYYESLPEVATGSPARPKLDGWRALQSRKSVAPLLTAYRSGAAIEEAIDAQKTREAMAIMRKIDHKLVLSKPLLGATQCRLLQVGGDLAAERTCREALLERNADRWRAYLDRADYAQRNGDRATSLAIMERGYQHVGRPIEALPTLVEYSREVDTTKRDAYNAQCLLTTTLVRQACSEALLSPAQRKAQTDAETARVSENLTKPFQRQLDKIGSGVK